MKLWSKRVFSSLSFLHACHTSFFPFLGVTLGYLRVSLPSESHSSWSSLLLFVQGKQSFLLHLLSLYKVFTPELVTISIPSQMKVCSWTELCSAAMLLHVLYPENTERIISSLPGYVQEPHHPVESHPEGCPEEEPYSGYNQGWDGVGDKDRLQEKGTRLLYIVLCVFQWNENVKYMFRVVTGD